MARRAEITQERIDLAALQLFADKGVDRTTINDIAASAGIAEGTIYRHYPSKNELIWQLFSANYGDLAWRLDKLQERATGLRGKLKRLATGTGGRYFHAAKASDLAEIYAQIERELRSQYFLTFAPASGGEVDLAAVEVRVRNRGLKVRATRGYAP